MKKVWPWLIGLIIVIVIGGAILFGTGLLRYRLMPMFWHGRGWRTGEEYFWQTPGGLSSGYRALPVVGLLGGLLMLAFPLGILTLIVIGIVALVKSLERPKTIQSQDRIDSCQNCNSQIDPDWQVCPYCGEPLGKEA